MNFNTIFNKKLAIYGKDNDDNIQMFLDGYKLTGKGDNADTLWDSIAEKDDINFLIMGLAEDNNIPFDKESILKLIKDFEEYFKTVLYPKIKIKIQSI